MNMRAIVLLLIGLFLLPAAHAQIPGAPQNVRASIEAETSTPAPGDTVTIAIIMDPKPGWHDYWLNPGDAGTPLELDWQLPPGVTAGPIRAPVPETLIVGGFMNHIYKAKHAFLVDLKIGSNVQPSQQLDIKVDARWSACTDVICVPESGTLAFRLVTGNGQIEPSARDRFDAWRQAIPVPLESDGTYQIGNGRISLAIPYPASASIADARFFSLTEKLFDYVAPQSVRRDGNMLVLNGTVKCSAKRSAKPDPFGPVVCDDFAEISGLLRLDKDQGVMLTLQRGNVAGFESPAAVSGSAFDFIWILGFSILGGLLLNLMPCVFPILGLKALSLAKMGGDESAARRDALAYSAGVILSCAALGCLLLALRAGGEEIGWAFQLQEPAFVLLLLLLLVAVTANLAGLFEIGSVGVGDSLARRSGTAGSFWTGVLAAVVATPCTGPFMAAALGAALLLPVAQALALFAGLGFGLALPFLLLAYVPAVRRILPKPGPWLDSFRTAMAVPMALTALALLWLLWRLTGTGGLLVGGTVSAVIIAGLAYLGKAQKTGGPVRMIAGAIAFVAALTLVILPSEAPAPSNRPDLLASQPFSEARLAELRGKGTPIFAYFTADWCVTCKVNEATAINRDETKAVFDKAGIVVLKGDYTRRDPAIARFLAQHGRSGVPLYIYYPKGGEPVVLPQILTVDTLTKLTK